MTAPAPLALLVAVATASSLLVDARTTADGRFTDGEVADEGDGWRAPSAVVLRAERWPEWDLGASRRIAGGALQGDGNDEYVLSVSEDGTTWTDVHTFPSTTSHGLRTRTGTFEAHGRYLRLRGEGGDGLYSVSELQLFPDAFALWTSPLGRPGPRTPLFYPWAALLLVTAVTLAFVSARSSRAVVAIAAVALVSALVVAMRASVAAERIAPDTLDFIRGVVAASALLAILRTIPFRRVSPAANSLVTGILTVCAALAVLCFLNFGRPQFHDAGRGAPTFLHHYDMRTYFPIAKYFPELRFDGVYAASAAVVIEEVGLTRGIGRRTMTDLRTHARPTIAESEEAIREVRARFRPERWSEFVEDMAYFRRAMTDDGFLGTMNDHGGNATPVWFLGARALFVHAPASDVALWSGVVADIVLMLLAFGAIAWAFSPRTALVAMIVWGAMDLYMFGSNWFGAALRHDWMALWAVGLALLKKERFFAAGGVLAYAGLIRVFPIASFLTILSPVAFALVVELRERRRDFSLRAFLAKHRDFVRFCAGALVVGLSLIAVSVMIFGLEAWPLWVKKIALMAGGRGINTVGLTNFVTDKVLLNTIAVAVALATLWSVRRSPLHEAAAFGVTLLPPLFSPMNYYLHALYLLALLGSATRVFPWVAALAMCVGCYFTTLVDGGFEAHFDAEAANVLVVGGVLLVAQLARSAKRAPAVLRSEVEPATPA